MRYAVLCDGKELERFKTKEQAKTWAILKGHVLADGRGNRFMEEGYKIRPVVEAFQLSSDKEKCKKCDTCERMQKGFKSKYSGLILISDVNMQRDKINNRVKKIIDACPESAISLSPWKRTM